MIINCARCNAAVNVPVKPGDLERWLGGDELIQNVMPYLTSAEREMLISRTCDDCWDELFCYLEEEY